MTQHGTSSVTLKEYYINYLVLHGFLEAQAETVFDSFASSTAPESTAEQWDEPINYHPDTVRHVGLYELRAHALRYIDEYMPLVWFRDFYITGQIK